MNVGRFPDYFRDFADEEVRKINYMHPGIPERARASFLLVEPPGERNARVEPPVLQIKRMKLADLPEHAACAAAIAISA